MKYNTLGATGLRVSAVGLGGHEYRWGVAGHLENGRFTELNPVRRDVIARALDKGVNYFDTTYTEEVQSLGHWAGQLGCRSAIVVNGMIIDAIRRFAEQPAGNRKAFVAGEIDPRLKLLGRDWFDVFMMCAIDHGYNPRVVEDVVDEYLRYKRDGKIRFIGASCHDHAILLEFLKMDLPVDVVMFPYNFAIHRNWGGQFAVMPELTALMKQRNIGRIAMKPLNWFLYGIPFTCFGPPDRDIPTAVTNAFAWQTADQAVDASVVGVETVDELDDSLIGTGLGPDLDVLDDFVESGRRFDRLLANYDRHSSEIRGRILGTIKHFTGRDFGADLDKYERYWREAMDGKPLPFSRIL